MVAEFRERVIAACEAPDGPSLQVIDGGKTEEPV